MGYDLRSKSSTEEERQQEDDPGYYRFSIWGWRPVLALAEAHGWEPANTLLYNRTYDEETEDVTETDDLNPDWSGTYYSNDGQTVTAADAAALADALERALASIPDGNVTYPSFTFCSTEMMDTVVAREVERNPDKIVLKHSEWDFYKNPADLVVSDNIRDEIQFRSDYPELFWAGDKDYLADFIPFCRRGEFQIF